MVDNSIVQQKVDAALEGSEYTYPGVERPWDTDDVRDVVEHLDSERAYGVREVTNWMIAANRARWTLEEVTSAIEWVNLNVTGYVKIAHVHARIVCERELFNRAKYLCYKHPAAAKAAGYDSVGDCIDDYNRDILGWKEQHGETAFAVLDRAAWIEWAEHVK